MKKRKTKKPNKKFLNLFEMMDRDALVAFPTLPIVSPRPAPRDLYCRNCGKDIPKGAPYVAKKAAKEETRPLVPEAENFFYFNFCDQNCLDQFTKKVEDSLEKRFMSCSER